MASNGRVLLSATVFYIGEAPFLYPACERCYCKLVVSSQDNSHFYQCPSCRQKYSHSQENYRYRLCMTITDSTAVASVTAFGGILSSFFGVTATEFHKNHCIPLKDKHGPAWENIVKVCVEQVLLGQNLLFGLKTSSSGYRSAWVSSGATSLKDICEHSEAVQQRSTAGCVPELIAVQLLRHSSSAYPTTVVECLHHLESSIKEWHLTPSFCADRAVLLQLLNSCPENNGRNYSFSSENLLRDQSQLQNNSFLNDNSLNSDVDQSSISLSCDNSKSCCLGSPCDLDDVETKFRESSTNMERSKLAVEKRQRSFTGFVETGTSPDGVSEIKVFRKMKSNNCDKSNISKLNSERKSWSNKHNKINNKCPKHKHVKHCNSSTSEDKENIQHRYKDAAWQITNSLRVQKDCHRSLLLNHSPEFRMNRSLCNRTELLIEKEELNRRHISPCYKREHTVISHCGTEALVMCDKCKQTVGLPQQPQVNSDKPSEAHHLRCDDSDQVTFTSAARKLELSKLNEQLSLSHVVSPVDIHSTNVSSHGGTLSLGRLNLEFTVKRNNIIATTADLKQKAISHLPEENRFPEKCDVVNMLNVTELVEDFPESEDFDKFLSNFNSGLMRDVENIQKTSANFDLSREVMSYRKLPYSVPETVFRDSSKKTSPDKHTLAASGCVSSTTSRACVNLSLSSDSVPSSPTAFSKDVCSQKKHALSSPTAFSKDVCSQKKQTLSSPTAFSKDVCSQKKHALSSPTAFSKDVCSQKKHALSSASYSPLCHSFENPVNQILSSAVENSAKGAGIRHSWNHLKRFKNCEVSTICDSSDRTCSVTEQSDNIAEMTEKSDEVTEWADPIIEKSDYVGESSDKATGDTVQNNCITKMRTEILEQHHRRASMKDVSEDLFEMSDHGGDTDICSCSQDHTRKDRWPVSTDLQRTTAAVILPQNESERLDSKLWHHLPNTASKSTTNKSEVCYSRKEQVLNDSYELKNALQNEAAIVMPCKSSNEPRVVVSSNLINPEFNQEVLENFQTNFLSDSSQDLFSSQEKSLFSAKEETAIDTQSKYTTASDKSSVQHFSHTTLASSEESSLQQSSCTFSAQSVELPLDQSSHIILGHPRELLLHHSSPTIFVHSKELPLHQSSPTISGHPKESSLHQSSLSISNCMKSVILADLKVPCPHLSFPIISANYKESPLQPSSVTKPQQPPHDGHIKQENSSQQLKRIILDDSDGENRHVIRKPALGNKAKKRVRFSKRKLEHHFYNFEIISHLPVVSQVRTDLKSSLKRSVVEWEPSGSQDLFSDTSEDTADVGGHSAVEPLCSSPKGQWKLASDLHLRNPSQSSLSNILSFPIVYETSRSDTTQTPVKETAFCDSNRHTDTAVEECKENNLSLELFTPTSAEETKRISCTPLSPSTQGEYFMNVCITPDLFS